MKKLKKILLLLFTAILVIAISIGITLAYLTDEAKADNVMTIGKVDIELLEYERINTETKDAGAKVQEFHDNKPLLPAVIAKDFNYTPGATYVDWKQSTVGWEQEGKDGYTSPIWDPAKINNEVDKMVFVKNTGNYSAYVRIYFAFEAGNYATYDRFSKMIHINLNDTATDWKWEWTKELADINGSTYFLAVATYQKELKAGDFTEISLSQIALDPHATSSDVAAFGDTYNVKVIAQGMQQAGFTSIDRAFNEGFGSAIPFENLTFVTPIKLETALHYLDGNDKGTKITDKVTNIIFGKTKDHAKAVGGKNGVWVANLPGEADFVARAYYVPTADDKYDIYVLADGDIYTPNDSNQLFRYMYALKTVDTTNMDVSHTQNMKAMFGNCYELTDIDTSKWDTSNVTNMQGLFYVCKKLSTLDVSKWDVSRVTTFASFIANNTEDGDMAIEYLDVTDWDTSSATSMYAMFFGCGKIKELDLSRWDVSNVTNMSYMFADCLALEKIDFTGWNTANLLQMDYMFNDCHALKVIDVSDFDTQKVTSMATTFKWCISLEKIIGLEKWDTSNVTNMHEMFHTVSALTVLDLSSFNTGNVENVGAMFKQEKENPNLKTIYVGDGWKMSKVTNSGSMFSGCTNLVGGAGTAYKDDPKTGNDYARVDDPANGEPGYFTHIKNKLADPEQNQQ